MRAEITRSNVHLVAADVQELILPRSPIALLAVDPWLPCSRLDQLAAPVGLKLRTGTDRTVGSIHDSNYASVQAWANTGLVDGLVRYADQHDIRISTAVGAVPGRDRTGTDLEQHGLGPRTGTTPDQYGLSSVPYDTRTRTYRQQGIIQAVVSSTNTTNRKVLHRLRHSVASVAKRSLAFEGDSWIACGYLP
ncbi:hypothetical protein HD806DRAFT_539140 [Xylariaceae sp. AK1471]|nr:hypothetical protein HD806DRAFT_539140 [Xylariaceae sp. AK1471]